MIIFPKASTVTLCVAFEVDISRFALQRLSERPAVQITSSLTVTIHMDRHHMLLFTCLLDIKRDDSVFAMFTRGTASYILQ